MRRMSGVNDSLGFPASKSGTKNVSWRDRMKDSDGALLSAHVTDSYLVVKGAQRYDPFQYLNIPFEILQDIMVSFA